MEMISLPTLLLAVAILVGLSAGLAYRSLRTRERKATGDPAGDMGEPQFFKRCPPPS